MIARKGLSPTAVLYCALLALAAYLVTRSDAVGHFFCAVAYLVAILSCRCLASLYPELSPMRWGWIALGLNCFISILRHVALNPLLEQFAGSRERVYYLSQTLQLPALLSVLVGLAAMWWGVYRLRLGFRIRLWEGAGIVASAAIVTWMSRHNLSHSAQGTLAALQATNLGLLIAIGGVGLLLHSLSVQMGGGRLSVVMRCIAVYALTRSLLTLVQGDGANLSVFWWLGFYAVPWIFAFGAAYCCWLADGVRRQYTMDATLSRSTDFSL